MRTMLNAVCGQSLAVRESRTTDTEYLEEKRAAFEALAAMLHAILKQPGEGKRRRGGGQMMAPLPKTFSISANTIETAINDGRAEEAMHKVAAALEAGNADRAVQRLAAEWMMTVGLKPGDAKALRGARKAFPEEWLDIAHWLPTSRRAAKPTRERWRKPESTSGIASDTSRNASPCGRRPSRVSRTVLVTPCG